MPQLGLNALRRHTWAPIRKVAQAVAYVAVSAAVFSVLLAEAINEARS